MAKKNTGKVVQMLSPENYIRQKARNLPIHECRVNLEWEEQGFANLLVARRHINGNITVCFYLVDLFCLGVKNTHYMFNISGDEYQEISNSDDNLNSLSISYVLAHNIIYSGLEYAEELGFKPHKDFTSITRFMLEEDTEDVELIEIECGKDGKPLYISSPDEDGLKIKAVIKQLEKSAGAGNFDYISLADKENFDEEEDIDEEDEFEGYAFEEKKSLFLDLESQTESLNDKEKMNLIMVSNSLFDDITDSELVDEYYDEYLDDLDVEITDKISDELLGLLPGSILIENKTRDLFTEIYLTSNEKPRSARKLLEKFRKQTPDIPASYFLELLILKAEDSPIYLQKLDEYTKKYTNYPLIMFLRIDEQFLSEFILDEHLDQTFSLHSLFQGRDVLHHIEVLHYLMFALSIRIKKNDLSRLEAFYQAYQELDIDDEIIESLNFLVLMAKMRIVHLHLNQ